MDELLKWLPSIVAALVGGAASYFVSRFDKRLDEHDRRDDERFDKMAGKVDALKDDTVTKRHAFRSEVHGLIGEVELRLTHDIRRIEDKVDR